MEVWSEKTPAAVSERLVTSLTQRGHGWRLFEVHCKLVQNTLNNTAGLAAWRVDYDLVNRRNNSLLERRSVVSDLITTTRQRKRSGFVWGRLHLEKSSREYIEAAEIHRRRTSVERTDVVRSDRVITTGVERAQLQTHVVHVHIVRLLPAVYLTV